MANIDYRKYYEDYYGINIQDGFVIHHIDGNRNNNRIDNLLMLPNELHARYHFYKNHFIYMNFELQLFGKKESAWLRGYADIIEECEKYLSMKYEQDLKIHQGSKK